MNKNSDNGGFGIKMLVGDEWTEPEAVAGLALLRALRREETWPEVSVVPRQGDFPRMNVSFHNGRGYVLQCYEDETSMSDFLVTRSELSAPTIEIELGGQALERWPPELFVPEELGARAVDHFLATGTQDGNLEWVGISAFPRETVWEGREQHDAWRRSQGLPPLPEARTDLLEAILKQRGHIIEPE